MERLILKNQESLLQTNNSSVLKAYLKSIYLRLTIGASLLVILILIGVISILTGSMDLTIKHIFMAIIDDTQNSFVVWNLRISRITAAILAGGSLGVAGSVMQNVLKNPLASPFTLGVSQGAAFGAAVAIILLGAGHSHSYGTEGITVFEAYPVVISAFLGSLLTVILILGLSFLRNITAEAILLTGVALSSLFGAATMFLQYFAHDFQAAATIFWTFGDIGKAGWLENKFMFLSFLFCFIYFFVHRWNYNALLWGDEVAKSLGVNVRFIRASGMFLSALMVSVCTAFLGIIGFVGLISPHVARLLIGNDHRFLIPYSGLLGAIILSLSDIVARTIMAPTILPVGIITSFAGAPMFFYLLIKKRRP